MGGGSDSCFLPLLTQPLEVTGSGGNWRVSAWDPDYLGSVKASVWSGEGSNRRDPGWGRAHSLKGQRLENRRPSLGNLTVWLAYWHHVGATE